MNLITADRSEVGKAEHSQLPALIQDVITAERWNGMTAEQRLHWALCWICDERKSQPTPSAVARETRDVIGDQIRKLPVLGTLVSEGKPGSGRFSFEPAPAPPAESRKKASYIGAPKVFALESACRQINEAFGGWNCYLVGSAMERPDWRDVDVRYIMDDEQFEAEFPDAGQCWEQDAKWLLLNVSISERLSKITDLPIDFQIQPRTHANERHKGQRSAVGLKISKPAPIEKSFGGAVAFQHGICSCPNPSDEDGAYCPLCGKEKAAPGGHVEGPAPQGKRPEVSVDGWCPLCNCRNAHLKNCSLLPAAPESHSESGPPCIHCHLPLSDCQAMKWETMVVNRTRINFRYDEHAKVFVGEIPRMLTQALTKETLIRALKSQMKFRAHIFETGELPEKEANTEQRHRAFDTSTAGLNSQSVESAMEASGVTETSSEAFFATNWTMITGEILTPNHCAAVVKFAEAYAAHRESQLRQRLKELEDKLSTTSQSDFCPHCGHAIHAEMCGELVSYENRELCGCIPPKSCSTCGSQVWPHKCPAPKDGLFIFTADQLAQVSSEIVRAIVPCGCAECMENIPECVLEILKKDSTATENVRGAFWRRAFEAEKRAESAEARIRSLEAEKLK